MRRINVEGHWVTQSLRKALLNKKRQSSILVAEEVHGWHLVPGLKGSRLQEGGLGVRLQLGDGGCLGLGGHVVVEDGFLLGGATVAIIGVLW